jgi:hypothetical protein
VYVPREESISNWTKQFTIQFHEDVKASPIAWMTDLRSLMQKRCPGSYWQVLNQDSASVLYEWKISGCGGNPNQHEIARLLKGNDGLHRIAYVEHASTIDPAVRDQWIKAFSDAYVHKNGKRIVTAP